MNTQAELLNTEGDYSLVSWSGRKFPGLLVQGDSLSILAETLAEAREELQKGDADEAQYAVDMALNTARSMLEAYERMMNDAGLNLPYSTE
ncbi:MULTISPECIES: hypothetical protein [Nocardia]|uniref:DUF6959 family protein n=1 Tax=Nocardia TaxID=1817 RepID=UPI000A92F67A|nr:MULTISPECIES: hypothetical protein [Nocardia]